MKTKEKTEEMAQSVKQLLFKLKNLNLTPGNQI